MSSPSVAIAAQASDSRELAESLRPARQLLRMSLPGVDDDDEQSTVVPKSLRHLIKYHPYVHRNMGRRESLQATDGGWRGHRCSRARCQCGHSTESWERIRCRVLRRQAPIYPRSGFFILIIFLKLIHHKKRRAAGRKAMLFLLKNLNVFNKCVFICCF